MTSFLESMRETVRAAVVQELRASVIDSPSDLALVVPCDPDAEQEVCSAVLCGVVRPAELDLLGRDFYSHLMAYVFVACDAVIDAGMQPSVESVAKALWAADLRGVRIEEELEQIAHATPCLLLPDVVRRAERIRTLAQTRRAVATLEALTVQLKTGAVELSEAKATLLEQVPTW